MLEDFTYNQFDISPFWKFQNNQPEGGNDEKKIQLPIQNLLLPEENDKISNNNEKYYHQQLRPE